MAEKLATRVISSPTELFALADKCARAAEARERQSGCPDAKEAKVSDPQAGPSTGGKRKRSARAPLSWWLQRSPLRASRDVTRILLARRKRVELMRSAPSTTRGLMTSGIAASSRPSLRRGGTALTP